MSSVGDFVVVGGGGGGVLVAVPIHMVGAFSIWSGIRIGEK